MSGIRQETINSCFVPLLEALRPDGSLAIGDSPSCRVFPSPLSELEAKFYFVGLGSAPPLVARTSTTPWKVPTSPQTYQKLQEYRAAVNKPFHWDRDRDAEIISKHDALLDSIEMKKLHPVLNHPLNEVWGDNLCPKVWALLNSMEVKWSTADVFRIGPPDWKEPFAPVILFIGVISGSLSGDYGAVVASECRKIFVEHDITDVDVEIYERR